MAESSSPQPKKASLVRIRFIIVFLTSLCPLVCYMARRNLNLAIIAMVELKESNTTHNQLLNNNLLNNTLDTCPFQLDPETGKELLVISYGPKYDWTPSQRSLLFEAFYFPYVIFQIPLSRMSEIFGAKWILVLAAAGSAVISVLSPYAASVHPYALALLRALMGICQTALFPTVYLVFTKWLPPLESMQAFPLISTGACIGTIIMSTATGYFNEQPSMGWPYAFYVPGVACAIWALVWLLLATSEPREHKLISKEELEYIESGLGEVDYTQKKSLDWKKMLTSRHVWILVIGKITADWVSTVTSVNIPSYLNYIHKVPQLKNGVINSAIYALNAIMAPIIGFLAAMMVAKQPFGINCLQVRKLFEGIAIFGQAIGFIILPLIACNTDLAVMVLFTQIVLYSFTRGGALPMHAEITRDFAGTIYALANSVSSTTGFIVPRLHSIMVPDNTSRSAWNTYFYLCAGIMTAGALTFTFFAKNDAQDFSKQRPSSIREEYKKISTLSLKQKANDLESCDANHEKIDRE